MFRFRRRLMSLTNGVSIFPTEPEVALNFTGASVGNASQDGIVKGLDGTVYPGALLTYESESGIPNTLPEVIIIPAKNPVTNANITTIISDAFSRYDTVDKVYSQLKTGTKIIYRGSKLTLETKAMNNSAVASRNMRLYTQGTDEVTIGTLNRCQFIFDSVLTKLTINIDASMSDLVFYHSKSDPITLTVKKPKNAQTVTIYTDCDAVKNYAWATQNYTVTWKTLSEWED